MKFKTFAKALYLALALILLVLATCFATLAEEAGEAQLNSAEVVAPSLEIVSNNLSYSEYLHIMYAVETHETAPADVEMLFWLSKPSSVTDAPDYVDSEAVSVSNGTENPYDCVFYSPGIAPKNSTGYIYAAAHIKNSDTYSAIARYSVLEYIYERQTTSGITEKQERLYKAVLEYCDAVQYLLEHNVENLPSLFRYVSAEGGFCEDGHGAGTYKIGTELTLVPDTSLGNFARWVDESGAEVSTSPEVKITVGESHVKYTAIFEGEGTAASVKVNADLFKIENDTLLHFKGWYSSSGELVSTVASDTLLGGDTYTAQYGEGSEFSNYELLDFENGDANGFGLYTDAHGTTKYSGGDASVYALSWNKIGNSMGYDLYAKIITYANRKFASGANSTLKVLSFDMLLMNESSYESKIGNVDIYTVTLGTGTDVLAQFNLVAVCSDGAVLGLNLAPQSDPETLLFENNLSASDVSNLGFELYLEDGEMICNIYAGGEYQCSVALDAANYNASEELFFSIGSTSNTADTIFIDNVAYREEANQ